MCQFCIELCQKTTKLLFHHCLCCLGAFCPSFSLPLFSLSNTLFHSPAQFFSTADIKKIKSRTMRERLSMTTHHFFSCWSFKAIYSFVCSFKRKLHMYMQVSRECKKANRELSCCWQAYWGINKAALKRTLFKHTHVHTCIIIVELAQHKRRIFSNSN